MASLEEIEAFKDQLQVQLNMAHERLVEQVALALRSEFGHVLRAGSGDESWRKAAEGIVNKLGLKPKAWIDQNNVPYLLANFPIAGERSPLYYLRGC